MNGKIKVQSENSLMIQQERNYKALRGKVSKVLLKFADQNKKLASIKENLTSWK